MIKRLWQFPAVIGGTALLTFCGVSALQAGINAPLHAFGAVVEAARASASANLSPTLVAAAPPVQKAGEPDFEATTGATDVQAAAAAPTSSVCAVVSCPTPGGTAQAATAQAATAQAAQAQAAAVQAPDADGVAQAAALGQGDDQQGDDQQGDGQQGLGQLGQGQAQLPGGNGRASAQGQAASAARGPGSNGGTTNAGAAGQALGQLGRGAGQAASAAASAQNQLAREVNRWLGLTDPPGLAGRGNQGGNGKSGASGR